MFCFWRVYHRGVSSLVGILVLLIIIFATGYILFDFVSSFAISSSTSSNHIIDVLNYECKNIDYSTNTVRVCIRNIGGKEVLLGRAYFTFGDSSRDEGFIGQLIKVSISYVASGGEEVKSVKIYGVDVVNPGFLRLNITINYVSDVSGYDSRIRIVVSFGDGGGFSGDLSKVVDLRDGGNKLFVSLEGVVEGVAEDGVIEDQVVVINNDTGIGYGYIYYKKISIEPESVISVWIRPKNIDLRMYNRGIRVRVTTYEGGILIINL